MIDRKTGCITLSPTCQLKAGGAFDATTALPVEALKQVVDRKNGWKWLTVNNLKVDDTYVIISLGFYLDALKQIALIVAEDRFDLTANWNAWSEQNELDLLKKLRIWLIDELGRDGKFDWGEVQTGYDPKSGSSSITILYT